MRLRKNLALIGVATVGAFGLSACGSSLADSCEDYYDYDQEYATEIQQVMETATSPDATEQDLADAKAFMQEARGDFEGIVAEADDEEFLESAEQSLPTYELFEQLTEPGLSQEEQMELIQDPDLQSGLQAEAELIELCDAELN